MDDAADLDLPRGIALAWGIAADPQRGPKREMSVERIVEAAVELADADGLSAVSMAAVAAKLGYTPMSLYRYVSAKDDLILLMLEEATGLPPEAAREGAWRAQLRALYDAQLQAYLRHPWALDIPISGSPTTPSTSAWMDAGLGALADTPLTHDERMSVLLLVTGQARWAGMIMAGYARMVRERQVDDGDIAQQEDALYRLLITADAYPHLRAAIDAGVFLDESDPFAFGLERSLDGVAAYIDAVSAAGARAQPSTWPGTDDGDIADDKRFREARKAVREAEKALREARRRERQEAREARERLERRRRDG
ncbi:TetR/AcrR family transcriptional regulator [Microbacterium sp. No. 7]|uniref:TetR/AcrR family transcriptional regulator n=1 Tax=Microbacterium sp. No. 7 TaxID=1714373 RepID=UPI0006D02845|nr:TetR/AcrR family transcriptional regulator C-terminal domain-containing protein [Microbacterium sp. No. 7]ALJ19802.1 TetR family transcriptional regulator [Microbacterium sp. No. 7]